jgi:Glycosyl transferase family 4
VHDLGNRQSGRERGEQMYVIGHHHQFQHFTVQFRDVLRNQLAQMLSHLTSQYWTPIFRTPDQVVVDVIGGVACSFDHSKRIVSQLTKGDKAAFPTGFKPDVPCRESYGIDGIAGSEAIFVTGVVGVMLLGAGNIAFALVLGTFIAATAGFLALNFPPAKIFMGDVGSGFIGYELAVLSIATVQVGFSLWVWLILLGIFIVDTFITLFRRILQREKWYVAHRSHAYQHATTKYQNSHLHVLTGVLSINALWLTPLAILAVHWPQLEVCFTVLAYIPLVGLTVHFSAGVSKNYPYQSPKASVKDRA